MCVISKPKIAPISAPSAPPPPGETASGVQDSAASRKSNDLSSKRKGLKALLIEPPAAGLNVVSPVSGLKL